MSVYYNDNEPYVCRWLENLIGAGLIPKGDVDCRSIGEVDPDDLGGYTQCHFFAGIGGWAYALRLAGWSDDRPVWTGSCPCQPFSAAGKGKASGDERHLWPVWAELIRTCRPPTIFGEQVEAAIGWGWLDLVHSDLEAEGYTVGAAVLPACGVGAPHIRQRLWFVANAEGRDGEISLSERRQDQTIPESRGSSRIGELADCPPTGRPEGWPLTGNGQIASGGDFGELADATKQRNGESRHSGEAGDTNGRCRIISHGSDGILADTNDARCGTRRPGETGHNGASRVKPSGFCADSGLAHSERNGRRANLAQREAQERETNGRLSPWSDLVWLPCTDGKQRPTQPGIFPLAHGISGRVAKLRAIGNAIVPQVAAGFIKATM